MKESNVPIMHSFHSYYIGDSYKAEFYLDYGCQSKKCFCVYYKNNLSGEYIGMFKMKLK